MPGFFHLACFQGSSTLSHVLVLHSCLWLNNILLNTHTHTHTRICSFISWWIFCLLWIVFLWIHSYVFEYLFSVLQSINLRVELLGDVIILYLTFWAIIVVEPFYIPTCNVWGFQFLHILINTRYFPFFKKKLVILVGVK